MQNTPQFSLIICTYMRAEALLALLKSVKNQTTYPDQLLIIDGSTNEETQAMLAQHVFNNLEYYKVNPAERGLTKQRNFGIGKVADSSEIVCFLDDDTVLDPHYFAALLDTYIQFPDALGVGGYITNETQWAFVGKDYQPAITEYYYDGWKRKDGSRFVLRKKLGLDSPLPPCFMPEFSHGRSVSFLPPSGKIYPVEQFMGGVSSFRKSVFETHRFSVYFQGYGLYEDADFTLRLSLSGKLYVNTAATLQHFHEGSGRPNQFSYGKMVVRNGWYVWRVRHPKPSVKARLKWNGIALLLTLVRFGNALGGRNKKAAFTEGLGRTSGWWSLLFNAPKMKQL